MVNEGVRFSPMKFQILLRTCFAGTCSSARWRSIDVIEKCLTVLLIVFAFIDCIKLILSSGPPRKWLKQTIFTVRRSYASAVLGVVILSVCLTVCHTRAFWLIQRTYRRYFYATWKGNPSSFLVPKISAKFPTGSPPTGAPNRDGVG